MATTLQVCGIDPGLLDAVKSLRMKRQSNNECLVLKIDTERKVVVVDEELKDMLPDEIQEELPQHQPRYLVYSYKYSHDDGRVSYPFVFIFISPAGCKPEHQMMYAGSKLSVVNEGGFTKVFELRSVEEFTEDWLKEKLKFFR